MNTSEEKEISDWRENPENGTDERLVMLREKIDRLDREILKSINERLSAAKDIGEIKKSLGLPVLDKSREIKVIENLISKNDGLLTRDQVITIYLEIIAACREIQNPLRITYFGPEATFTHLAALKHFGHIDAYTPQLSIRDVFDEVEKDHFHYGVVPVENSIEGAVNHTLDLFLESNLKICAEHYMPITHDLLNQSGNKDDIRVVYSHPQAIAQCRNWLRNYVPRAELKETDSTASAAKKAAEDNDAGAIASSRAGVIYGLKVAASRVEDHTNNMTRFLVIGKNGKSMPTGYDKTSLLFVTGHYPGALYKTLEPLTRNNLNMMKLESRPVKFEPFSYVFFTDIEGHVDDKAVADTLSEMKSLCQFMKVLGSYPRDRQRIEG